MTEKAISYIDFPKATWLHYDLMLKWKEDRWGIDQFGLLESALARPKHAAIYQNADIVAQAATLCFGLIKNHPWLGGNKRTATKIVEVFLDRNGYRIVYKIQDRL